MQQRSFLNKGLWLAFFGIIADQISKSYIIFGLELARAYEGGMPVVQSFNDSIEITSFFNIVLVWNFGVSFGMFNDGVGSTTQTFLLAIMTLAIVGVIVYMLKSVQNNYLAASYGLVIGGALGNLIDRIVYGAVVDFLDVHVSGWHWPAFNVADALIFIGVLLLVFEGFFVKDVEHEKS